VSGRSLGSAPVYLYHDEAIYALNALSLLSNGHDLNGLRLPLFFHTFAWVPPIAIYSRALAFLFLPVSEATTRLPGVLILAVDVALTYVVGRRLFRRDSLAILAAVLLMLTPAHFMHARLATDHICHLPSFIVYLLLMIDYIERRRVWVLFGATACLGLGFYGYIGAMTAAPVFLAFTAAVLLVLGVRTVRPYIAAAGGFAAALLPFLLWLLIHPEQIGDQIRSYVPAGGAGAAPPSVGAALFSAIMVRLDAYYAYFDPALLFFRGDGSPLDSTREVGVFLLPIVVLLPAGAYYILKHRRTAADFFILAGFFVAPIGALAVGEAKASRALVMAPLAALVSARGVECLVRRSTAARIAAVALVLGMAVQFQQFYRDYMGGYRERSSVWFESNRDGAFDRLVGLAAPTQARMYVSDGIPLVHFSWEFYASKHERPDLTRDVAYFNPDDDVSRAPRGSLFLAPYEGEMSRVHGSRAMTRIAVVENADRHPAFAIYRQ
jgi:4-amino-4-deoxy-L-arabinose transferase-like glycosyltransferase